MKLFSALTILALTSLVGCSSTPKINVMQASGGGEVVTIPNRGISVALPTGWYTSASRPADTLFVAGAENGALRFALVNPSGTPKNLNVASTSFQNGVKGALAENGFTKVTHAELIRISGQTAFLCAATSSRKSETVMQVHMIHRGRALMLVFYSTKKPVTQVASVRSIFNSFQAR